MNRKRGIRTGLAAIAGLAMLVALPVHNAGANQPTVSPDTLAAQGADAGVGALATGPDQSFRRVSLTPGGGGLFYAAYERTYRGLDVIGGDVVVVADGKGSVVDTVTAATTQLALDTTAKLDPAAATAIARTELSVVEGEPSPRLVVFAIDTAALAYEVVVSGRSLSGEPSVLHVFVDANSGAVLDRWDDVREGTGNGFYYGQVTINTQLSGGLFRTIDPTRPGVRCAQQGQTSFTGSDDVWGNGSGTSLETACVDALFAAQRQWDMLSQWLGRNGINGSGGGFPAFVGLAQANAFWNGSSATFGRSSDGQRQVVPIDVVAHEFGHGIFQFTPGGSGGSNEKGGLNESSADIFGAVTEAFANNPNDPPDYQVGEEVNLVGSGPIRFMYQPSLRSGHPNCFSSAVPSMEVHAAAGVQNHWFYLLAEGSSPGGGKPSSPTCNGSSVTGIGVQTAAQIFYNTLLRKTSTWTHGRARLASLQAARALFPSTCTEFNTVRAAWNAVSVPTQSGEPTC